MCIHQPHCLKHNQRALKSNPYNARCLAFHETNRVVRSPSAGQVRQALYTTSIGAWKHYESSLQPLKDALGDQVN